MAINNNNLKQFNVQHYAGPVSRLPAKLPFGDFYFAEDIGVLYKYNYEELPISLGGAGGGTSYQRAETFSTLVDGSSIGDLAYVNTSEGTVWLPGTFGGSYYASGWYLWNGSLWISDRNSIANQFETNINSLNTKVDKVSGKELSSNDLTNALKTQYDSNTSWINTNGDNLIDHKNSVSNPHNVTKSQVGLGSVDNTSDLNKPLSSATILALNSKVNTAIGERLINASEIIKLSNTVGINTGDFLLSDDLIIQTASKQNTTFINNVFTFANTADYTNNTKTLVYTGSLLTSAIHLFRYDSKDWTVSYTYNYIVDVYSGVTKTITKT